MIHQYRERVELTTVMTVCSKCHLCLEAEPASKVLFACFLSSLQKMTLLLALVALISAFGSSFQYGYNVSVINSPAPVGWTVELDHDLDVGFQRKQGRSVTADCGGCGQMVALLHALKHQGTGEKWFPWKANGLLSC